MLALLLIFSTVYEFTLKNKLSDELDKKTRIIYEAEKKIM